MDDAAGSKEKRLWAAVVILAKTMILHKITR
jgi:hypothetical protein